MTYRSISVACQNQRATSPREIDLAQGYQNPAQLVVATAVGQPPFGAVWCSTLGDEH